MDIMLAGKDQSQADQPNSLAEGPLVHVFMLQLSCPRRQLFSFFPHPITAGNRQRYVSVLVVEASSAAKRIFYTTGRQLPQIICEIERTQWMAPICLY
eukprot:1140566-Pelagomonas_calceolata.AAC.1